MRSFIRTLFTAIAMIAAPLAAAPAAASDWVVAARDTNRTVVVLVDRDTLTRDENGMVRVWIFYAFAVSPTDKVFGIAWHQEYDCRNSRYRRLFVRSYDTNSRQLIEGEKVSEWRENSGGDIGEAVQKTACDDPEGEPDATRDTIPLEYARGKLLDPARVQR